jgi:flagellar basal body rod protein FlgB
MPTPALSVVDQVSASLSVASLQHQVIASNIANRDTQGYQRLQLRFAQAMGEAGAVAVTADAPEAPVSLEQDLVALSANSAHYAALAGVLTRYFSIIGSITNYSRG